MHTNSVYDRISALAHLPDDVRVRALEMSETCTAEQAEEMVNMLEERNEQLEALVVEQCLAADDIEECITEWEKRADRLSIVETS